MMRRILIGATLVALTATLNATAQTAGKFINLFDGETLFGWTPIGDMEVDLSDDSINVVGGSGGLIATNASFHDFELTMEVRLRENCTAGVAFRAATDGHPLENGSSVVWIEEPRGSGSPWRTIRIVAEGNALRAELDGSAADLHSGENRVGKIALLYHHNNNARLSVRNVRLRPLQLTPIFNDKDLSGWNIIPGRQSQFSVVDGALNIRDGNGQIETADTYRDFVLQLDIISNGEHLNSGVFFRGPVGVFWKGYESQVRNQWSRDDRTRPVDFGTGGIYGNQKARKVVSSDHEWFTKTIVVNDNHMAVWIDGYQVSDFTDTRPVNKNHDGKAGYVPIAGTIHLQGHDPTTDLSFREIHIAETPERR